MVEEGKANIDGAKGSGMPPLCLASWKGRDDVVEYLLGRGANPGIKDQESRTPLIHAAISGRLSIVRRLLAAGPERAAIDAEEPRGMSALMHACREDHADIVRELMLRGGATVFKRTFLGGDLAVCRGNEECALVVKVSLFSSWVDRDMCILDICPFINV
jgi:ankyrin repeat protein